MFRFLIEKGEGREIQKKHFEEGIRDPWFLFAKKNLLTWGSGRGGGGLAPLEFGRWDEQACHSDSVTDAAHGDDDFGDCNIDHNKDKILEITTSRNFGWNLVKRINKSLKHLCVPWWCLDNHDRVKISTWKKPQQLEPRHQDSKRLRSLLWVLSLGPFMNMNLTSWYTHNISLYTLRLFVHKRSELLVSSFHHTGFHWLE